MRIHCYAASAVISLLVFAGSAFCGKIMYPWNAASAVVKAGESFMVYFDADTGEEVDSVGLVGPYNRITVTSVTSEKGDFIYDNLTGAAYNTRVTVPVPRTAPEELYDLVLFTSNGQELSRSAVKVVEDFPTSYTILHLSDTHISRHYKDGHAEELAWFTNVVDIANIIGPDLVFITGDCIHESTKNGHFTLQEKWDFFYNGFENLQGVYAIRAPVFIVAGNHDYFQTVHNKELDSRAHRETNEGAAEWNEYNGLRVYHFTFGESRFMVFDNFQGNDLTNQVDQHQDWLDEVGRGTFRAIAQHAPGRARRDTTRARLTVPPSFENANTVQLAMEGHHHLKHGNSGTGTRGITPTVWSIPGSTSNITNATGLDNVGWFRVIRVDGAEVEVLPRLQYADNVDDPPAEHNVKLRLEYLNSNDGSAAENTATLINEFDQDFPRSLVRFVLSKGVYDITSGEVVRIIENDTVTVIDVRITLKANSSIGITVTPSEVPVIPGTSKK